MACVSRAICYLYGEFFIMKEMNFDGKKVLIMGLGTLGGGSATAKWFVKRGARVIVTDRRKRGLLTDSIRKLGRAAKNMTFVLGEHRESDFKANDIIVVNPAVPKESKYLAVARKNKKILVNDARIFFDAVRNPIIAVTGTRGKTTTTNWIAHFLKSRDKSVVAGGNSSAIALLDLAEKLRSAKTPTIIELSSWQLEFLPGSKRAPDVAVITNLYPDHLNRYQNMKEYALAKANIFKGQKKDQALVLNDENPWTPFFLTLRRESRVYFFSRKPLPAGKKGIFLKGGSSFYFRGNDAVQEVISGKMGRIVLAKGEHNVMNFMAAALAAHLSGVSWREIARSIKNLPAMPYREEVILRKSDLTVINDSAATSPEAVIAALRRFRNEHRFVLITGGTDKNLDFKPLAAEVKSIIEPASLFLLNGSATKKLLLELKKLNYFGGRKPPLFENLEDILKTIQNTDSKIPSAEKRILLFSPGAASFEKFKNEFDRGEKFNRLVRGFHF